MIDLSWVIEECPIFLAVPVLCLCGTAPDLTIRTDNITSCQVDMGDERFGTHHSKFAIIKYLNGVRICITTANFIQDDFTYRTQGIFVQDFPTQAPNHHRDIGSKRDFESTLIDYLQVLRVSSSARKILDAIIRSLSTDYDFSSAEVVLIPSLPGRHTSRNPLRRNGLGIAKLSRLLKEEYARIGDSESENAYPVTLVMQFSSLGSMGKDAKLVDDYAAGMLPPNTSKLQRNKVEIVWPTVDCVRNSLQVGSVPTPYLSCTYMYVHT